MYLFIYLFGVLRRFQHCTGHITTDSWKGRGNQYIQFARVVYCKLPTNGKQLPAFPLKAVTGIEPRPQRWEARVLPLCHRGPQIICINFSILSTYNNAYINFKHINCYLLLYHIFITEAGRSYLGFRRCCIRLKSLVQDLVSP